MLLWDRRNWGNCGACPALYCVNLQPNLIKSLNFTISFPFPCIMWMPLKHNYGQQKNFVYWRQPQYFCNIIRPQYFGLIKTLEGLTNHSISTTGLLFTEDDESFCTFLRWWLSVTSTTILAFFPRLSLLVLVLSLFLFFDNSFLNLVDDAYTEANNYPSEIYHETRKFWLQYHTCSF